LLKLTSNALVTLYFAISVFRSSIAFILLPFYANKKQHTVSNVSYIIFYLYINLLKIHIIC